VWWRLWKVDVSSHRSTGTRSSARGLSSAAAAAAIDSDFDGVSDSGDAFPCDWRRTAVTFVPGEEDFATLMFEDNWPARGDLEFNDAVLLHNVALFHDASGRATGLRLTLVPRAIGANIASGVALRLPIPASSVGGIVRTVGAGSPTALTVLADETDLVLPVVRDRDLFHGAVGFINTERALPSGGDGDVVTVELTFAQPVSLSLASDPFDVYFFPTDDPRHQIHRPQAAAPARSSRAASRSSASMACGCPTPASRRTSRRSEPASASEVPPASPRLRAPRRALTRHRHGRPTPAALGP
jgi:LruC domain-containing protein